MNEVSAVHGANCQVAELTRRHLDFSPQRFRLDLLFKEVNGLQPTALIIVFSDPKFFALYKIYRSVATSDRLRIVVPVLEACCLAHSIYCYKRC